MAKHGALELHGLSLQRIAPRNTLSVNRVGYHERLRDILGNVPIVKAQLPDG